MSDNIFIKEYFEKFVDLTNNNQNILKIKIDTDENSEKFINHLNIPYLKKEGFIIYSGSNCIDLYGKLYNDGIKNDEVMKLFRKFIEEEIELGFKKISPDALTPSKSNYSDVGLDLTAIGISKKINDDTFLCKTGISLEIPTGYYVEIVPRSSISKSGFMLANSVGIIDCSYKGELLIALTKINKNVEDPVFPFRCCQIIMKKQIYPIMKEITEISESSRGEGGFGSTG